MRKRKSITKNCAACQLPFAAAVNEIKDGHGLYCSRACFGNGHKEKYGGWQTFKCSHCESDVKRKRSVQARSKTGRFFCNNSCSASYFNAHKSHGSKRSKLEAWIELKLKETYPILKFKFNETDAINAELDIYLPDLKLGFELNGIFHYEPIFGEARLASTQTNDGRKFQACAERGIALCVIDTTAQKNFREKTGQKYLQIILNIIQKHLGKEENSNLMPFRAPTV